MLPSKHFASKHLTALVGVGLSALAATAFAASTPQPTKVDAALAHVIAAQNAQGWTNAIVRVNGPLSVERQEQLAQLDVDVTRHLSLIHSFSVRVPTKNVGKLAALPYVTHVSNDGIVQKSDAFTVGSSGAGVAYQQYGLTGQGVTVAVVDSGIISKSDLQTPNGLANRILAGVSFVPPPSGQQATVADQCGHGTHVAGIIAGNGAASTGLTCYRTFYGIARNVNLVNVRVLDQNGAGTVSGVISGLGWVVANRAKYNIRVINLSLGHPVGESYMTDPLCQAVEAAYQAGIVVVCAAGNEGRVQNAASSTLDNEGYGTAYGTINSPGNDPYVITVGATKQNLNANGTVDTNRADDRIATYSSRGPSRLDLVLKPDIVAPGNKIISLDAPGSYLDKTYMRTNGLPETQYKNIILLGGLLFSGKSPDYYQLSGTSMATPVVSGAVALMLQQNPSLSPDTIKARLMISADKWTNADGTGNPVTYGAGYLNIPAAITCPTMATQPAMSPNMSADANGNVYINIDGSIWGTRAIWGTGITDLRAIWGKMTITGASANLLSGNRAIWGKSVWSDRAIWGKNSTSTSSVDLSNVVLNGE